MSEESAVAAPAGGGGLRERLVSKVSDLSSSSLRLDEVKDKGKVAVEKGKKDVATLGTYHNPDFYPKYSCSFLFFK